MDGSYEELFQRIRAKCLQRRWHGPDISNPFEIVAQARARREEELERNRKRKAENARAFVFFTNATQYWYDRNRKQYAINLDTDLDSFPLQTDFENPPATEEQVGLYEKDLGFSFPPLLRALYTTVANGGFGPGYGLTVLTTREVIPDGSPLTTYYRPVDFAVYLRKYDTVDYFEFPWYVWPESFFRLCDWGCGYDFYLDCVSGRVFYGGAALDGCGMRLQASSLEEWLNLWVDDQAELERRIYGRKTQ